MKKYAVIGNPIKHSKSPQIHSAFAQQEGVTIEYTRIHSETNDFNHIVNDFFSQGGAGLNVTVPFKVSAYQQCTELNEYAEAAQAVNTLSVNENQQWIGANTDGIGLLRDLKSNLSITLQNKTILILGAGGATRGILLPLLKEHPIKLVIANRTISKATQLADTFKQYGVIDGCGYEKIEGSAFDVVINATSASLDNSLPPISSHLVNENSICYDLAYSNEATAFMRWAKQHHVKSTHDGIGMLIEQAAESYYIWRGFKPNTKQVFQLLRPNAH